MPDAASQPPARSNPALPHSGLHAPDVLAALVIGALAIVIVWLGFHPAASHRMAFHPAQDSWWQGLAAQLVHLGLRHMSWNLMTFLAICVAASRLGRLYEVPLCLLVGALGVCCGLQFEDPPLAWYVGLSGALHGLFAWLALAVAGATHRTGLRVAAVLVFVATGLKIWFGMGMGIMADDIPVAYGAHLYGYIGGVLYAFAASVVMRYWRRRPRPAA